MDDETKKKIITAYHNINLFFSQLRPLKEESECDVIICVFKNIIGFLFDRVFFKGFTELNCFSF